MNHPVTSRAGVVETTAATAGDMEALGRQFGESLLSSLEGSGPLLVFLRGPLGAGKTTLARGVLRAYGVGGIVRSPTYTLVEPYETSFGRVTHVDLYRLGQPEEVEFLGLDGYLDAGPCLIEWPERGGKTLPPADVEIAIEAAGNPRRLRISPLTARGAGLMSVMTSGMKVSEVI